MYTKPLHLFSILCATALTYGCVGIGVQQSDERADSTPTSAEASQTDSGPATSDEGNGSGVESEQRDTPATTPTGESTPPPANMPTNNGTTSPSVGLIWASHTNPERVNTTSPQPTFDGKDALTAQISGIILVPVGDTTKFELACAHHVDLAVEDGEPPFASCIGMEFSLDTPADFPVDEANPEAEIKFARFVNADGSETPIDFSLGGDPGEVNYGLVIFGGPGGAGSTLEFSIGSELAGWTDFTYVVPDASEFTPIDWDAW